MQNPFEIVKQTEIEWCWAAVSATMSKYFAQSADVMTQCQVALAVTGVAGACDAHPPENANVAEPLDVALGKVKDVTVDPHFNTVLSFDDIRTKIDAGLPVCARVAWIGEFGAHFVVIYGWGISASGDQWLDIGDPFYDNSTILYDEFVHSYLAAGEWTDTYLVAAA